MILIEMTDNAVLAHFAEAAEKLSEETARHIKAYLSRGQWFIDRVGEVVYRNAVSCQCPTCTLVHTEGVLLTERGHAQYVYDCECDANREGEPLMYFDTKGERDEFEKAVSELTVIETPDGLKRCVDGLIEAFTLIDAQGIATFRRVVNNYIRLKNIGF